MKYSDEEMNRLAGVNELSTEDKMKRIVVPFVLLTRFNEEDFGESEFEYNEPGMNGMKIIKRKGEAVGYVTVSSEGAMQRYMFDGTGFEEA